MEPINNTIALPLQQLSIEQLKAHDLVLKSLKDGSIIRMIICGGAGTGTSTLIKAMVQSFFEYSKTTKAVRIMAPTGVAAFNIRGATIHHKLSIHIERRSSEPYKHITGDQCQRMQNDFKDTKLIIIDEYSMVGRAMLATVDLRCRDIFAKNKHFGNVSILLVGDIRQLPSVFDSPLYIDGGNLMHQSGGIAYAEFDRYIVLSRIFRQAGSEEALFREALQRFSNGTSTIEDWHLFRTRDYSIIAAKDKDNFKYALRIFITKQAANEYNCSRLIDLGKPIAYVLSKNNCDTSSNTSSDDAKGLEKVLCLSIGARVMLRANLATHNGLVNGAMGTIVDIVYVSGCKSPIDIALAVMVDFDNYHGVCFREGTNIIPIMPQTSNWKTST